MITKEREDDLYRFWIEETSEEESQEWRDTLSPEEATLILKWDNQYDNGVAKVFKKILALENGSGL